MPTDDAPPSPVVVVMGCDDVETPTDDSGDVRAGLEDELGAELIFIDCV